MPDILSRNLPNDSPDHESKNAQAASIEIEHFLFPEQLSEVDSLTAQSIDSNLLEFAHTSADSWYTKMLSLVKKQPNKYPNWLIQHNKLYFKFKNNNSMHHYWEYKLVIPESLRSNIIFFLS